MLGNIHDTLDVLIVPLDIYSAINNWDDQNAIDFGFFIGKGAVHAGFTIFSLLVTFVHYVLIPLNE